MEHYIYRISIKILSRNRAYLIECNPRKTSRQSFELSSRELGNIWKRVKGRKFRAAARRARSLYPPECWGKKFLRHTDATSSKIFPPATTRFRGIAERLATPPVRLSFWEAFRWLWHRNPEFCLNCLNSGIKLRELRTIFFMIAWGSKRTSQRKHFN